MREILEAVGPALELFGWIALLGAVGFFVVARGSRRGHSRWREATCELTELEGQQCLVWSSADGTAHSRALEDIEPRPEGNPGRLYYKEKTPHLIKLEQPRSHARFMLALAWTMLGLWALSNIVPMVMHQMLISAQS